MANGKTIALVKALGGNGEAASPEEIKTSVNEYLSENGVKMSPLTLTGAVEAEYDGSQPLSVDIPEEKEWRYIGEFTAADNINPWHITADENGNPFACKEFRITGVIHFFQLSTNATANRDIGVLGDDNKWYPVQLNNARTFPLTNAESIENVTPMLSGRTTTIDITTHGGVVVGTIANEGANNTGSVLLDCLRTRGLAHTANKFTAIGVGLGYATNLIVKGSYLKIWGR